MKWIVEFHAKFEQEFEQLEEEVQDEMYAHLTRLSEFGPKLGRPHVDTLNGSVHANMKELRLKAGGGVWRVAFAFDPTRRVSSGG
ncbi:MAG: hypothetical protein Tsb005_18880 [Gammaproteobacteria bacterium]